MLVGNVVFIKLYLLIRLEKSLEVWHVKSWHDEWRPLASDLSQADTHRAAESAMGPVGGQSHKEHDEDKSVGAHDSVYLGAPSSLICHGQFFAVRLRLALEALARPIFILWIMPPLVWHAPAQQSSRELSPNVHQLAIRRWQTCASHDFSSLISSKSKERTRFSK